MGIKIDECWKNRKLSEFVKIKVNELSYYDIIRKREEKKGI